MLKSGSIKKLDNNMMEEKKNPSPINPPKYLFDVGSLKI